MQTQSQNGDTTTTEHRSEHTEDGSEAFVARGAERDTIARPPSDAGSTSEDHYSRQAWKVRCAGCQAEVPAGNYCIECGDALPGGER